MLEYFKVENDVLKSHDHLVPLWNQMQKSLEVSMEACEDNEYAEEQVSKRSIPVVINSGRLGELYLRSFGDRKYIVCQFEDDEIWFNILTGETHAPSAWKYEGNFYIRKKIPKKKIKNCLKPEEAILLYNKGIALFNVISRDYAFKYANKHYVSKDIKRKNQHTFNKEIWRISKFTVERDLIHLLSISKKVTLIEANRIVGITGTFQKDLKSKKTFKNQVKREVKKIKHFMHNTVYKFKKIIGA